MFNLSISPPQTEIAIIPGTSFTQAYQVKNLSNQAVYLNTSVSEWIPQDSLSSIQYLDQTNPHISFSLLNSDLDLGQDFLLPPNSERQIILKAVISKDTPEKDAYFTFFVNQIDQTSTDNPGASGRIGAHVLISASTNLNQPSKFNLKSLLITPKIKDIFFTNLSFKIDLENQTNFFQKPIGQLVINKSDQEYKTLELDSQNILANHSRQIYCLDNPACSLKAPFWPGPYTAQIKLDNYTSDPVNFIILPLSPLVFFLILFFVYFIAKKTHQTNK